MSDEPIWVHGKRQREAEQAGMAAWVREAEARQRAREEAANAADDARDAAGAPVARSSSRRVPVAGPRSRRLKAVTLARGTLDERFKDMMESIARMEAMILNLSAETRTQGAEIRLLRDRLDHPPTP